MSRSDVADDALRRAAFGRPAMEEDERRPVGWMKLLLITAFAVLAGVPASLAQVDHFTVYKPWGNGEPVARDWFLRTEPGGIVVVRSDVFPDRLNGRNTTYVKKFNCGTKKYLVHQRYLNEELHWTEIDSIWTWKDVLLPDDADYFQWVCSWAEPLAKKPVPTQSGPLRPADQEQ